MTSPTPIRGILVANRGEIAARVMRTARRMGISTVAVHSDIDASAPYVELADRSVHLPGATSAETYLDGAAVIEAARRSGADAIHPGYGFLAENASFARAVQAAGLIWIGPSPESIDAMALKVEAKRIAAAAGVPLVPGAELPAGLTDEEIRRSCAEVGYPLLVKASAGGGGKGMRIVERDDELLAALESARREARSSFGDDTVFVERYLEGARHVEVQVFGDVEGSVVHLGERECSIQRRHQKVLEETPSPGVTSAVRRQLHESAISLSRAIGYVGAGTVEFMVFGSGDEQEYFFLEMNTRLQVEHPVTEMVTGVDLVAWQISVAQGQPLPLRQEQIESRGHAIEVRLYAEDPAHDYLPATGLIRRFAFEESSAFRVDSGVADGSVVTPYYDPMLAKVIGHASTREQAAALLADGLGRMTIHGPINNRASLIAILRSSGFLSGATTTAFLDEHPEVAHPVVEHGDQTRHVLAATSAVEAWDAPDPAVAFGWRNVPGVPEFTSLRQRQTGEVLTVLREAGGSIRLACSDEAPYSRVFGLNADTISDAVLHVRYSARDGSSDLARVNVQVEGVAALCSVSRYGDEVFVDDGLVSTAWSVSPRFVDHSTDAAGHGPATTVPGTITAIQVAAGDVVTVGQVLVVLEAMKMEHSIRADVDGVIEQVLVEIGQAVEAHTVVVEFRTGGDDD